MKVRRGTVEDIPSLVPLFKEFWENAKFSDSGLKFNPKAIVALLTRALGDRAIVVVAEDEGVVVGYALAAVTPFPFNPKTNVVSEISVYPSVGKTHTLLCKKARQVGSQLGAEAVCSAEFQLRALA